jgi:phasin family protein
MATKGPKPPVTAVAPKPKARAAKPVVPAIAAAMPAIEKPAPVAPAEVVPPFAAPEPVPAAQAATQEMIEAVQAAAEPAQTAVAEIVQETEDAAHAVSDRIAKKATTMETTFDTNTVKPQALFADWNDRTKAAVEKSTKLVEEANEFAKGNVEALVESGRIAASGLQTLGQDAADYGRRSFESATAAMKTLAGVKSPTEFFKLQSDFFRTSFDAYVAEASKNTEAMIKLAGDAAQPLSSRFAVAAEKVKAAA